MPTHHRRRPGRVETNTLRSPVWHACGDRMHDAQPLLAQSLLSSTVRVRASRRLSMRDKAVLAVVSEKLAPEGDPVVATSLYELGRKVYGHSPGGPERAALRESLARLWDVDLEIPG